MNKEPRQRRCPRPGTSRDREDRRGRHPTVCYSAGLRQQRAFETRGLASGRSRRVAMRTDGAVAVALIPTGPLRSQTATHEGDWPLPFPDARARRRTSRRGAKNGVPLSGQGTQQRARLVRDFPPASARLPILNAIRRAAEGGRAARNRDLIPSGLPSSFETGRHRSTLVRT